MSYPQIIWLIRHGESLGNLARQAAEKSQAKFIENPCREPDVKLSPLGESQAVKLGQWFDLQTAKPDIIYTSPYTRTLETTRLLLQNLSYSANILVKSDERLRERELGLFDSLTKIGAQQQYPDLFDLRERWGKFYFRPPMGESWADVVIRLRSLIETDLSKLPDANVLIITHELVIRCFRYILEELSEAEVLAIDSQSDVLNGAVTSYEFCRQTKRMTLKLDNFRP